MSLFSLLGSEAFANFGYGFGGLGALAGTYMMYRGAQKSRKDAKRRHREELQRYDEARKYDTPREQAKRFREAGFQPNRLSPGAYGPIVTNSSGDIAPVENPMFDMIERFGNTYNTLRGIRQSELDNEFRIKQADNANYHAQFDRLIKLKELDLKTKQFIEDTTRGRDKMRMLEDQHKDMLKLRTDIAEATKQYHNDMVEIARRNSKKGAYKEVMQDAMNSLKYFGGF